MSEPDLQSHVRKSVASNFVFNLAINGFLAWWLLAKHEVLSAWGDAAYGPDLIVTGFLLSAIVAAIVMELNRRMAKRGELTAPGRIPRILTTAASQSRWLTCFAIGAIGSMLSLIVVLVLFSASGSLTVMAYAAIKGVWAGVLAAAVVGPATIIGLRLGSAEGAQAGVKLPATSSGDE